MKKTIFLLLILLSAISYSQSNEYMAIAKNGNRFGSENLTQFINEVYGAHSNEITDSKYNNYYKQLLDYRLVFAEVSEELLSGLISTLDLEINNKYNQTLQHHRTFEQNSFNPFYYKIDFFPKELNVYRIADTNTLLMVLPMN